MTLTTGTTGRQAAQPAPTPRNFKPTIATDDQPRPLGRDSEAIKDGVLDHLEHTLAELPRHVDSEWEPFVSLALAVRDRMVERWIRTQDAYYDQDVKRVYYMSLEF